MFRRKTDSNKTIACLIGVGTRIEGNVFFEGGLRVDGHVHGNVYSNAAEPNLLVISENGRIDGEVHVGHLVVNGAISGPVSAAEMLELQPKARIDGDVLYKALEMHPGAIVRGRLTDAADALRPALKMAANGRGTR